MLIYFEWQKMFADRNYPSNQIDPYENVLKDTKNEIPNAAGAEDVYFTAD